MDTLWKTIVIVLVSTLLLRLSGRKSLAQMTPGTMATMIMLGAVMAGPLSGQSVVKAVGVIGCALLLLYVLERLQLRWHRLARILTGEAIEVIREGVVLVDNLKRARISKDKLEMRLRMVGIAKVEDVLYATIEVSRDLGYELKPEAKPLTLGDFLRMRGGEP